MQHFLYFDVRHAILVHDEIIDKSGGMKGIRDLGQLESILEHVQHDKYYPSVEDKVCHLFFSINKGHAFTDGNKRSSIILSAYFMEINGLQYVLGNFIREMENIAVDVADNRIGKDLLQEIVTSLIYETEYSDDLKMKIINAKAKGQNEFKF